MAPFDLRPYVSEVRVQALSAQQAFKSINVGVIELMRNEHRRHEHGWFVTVVELFRHLHSALVHSRNLAVLIWPADAIKTKAETREQFANRKAVMEQRSALLRTELGITEDNPLMDRKLRNHLEHFDERIDAYYADNPTRMADLILGGPDQASNEGVPKKGQYRHYDYRNKTMYFHGEPYPLMPLYTAVEDMYERAQTWIEALRR
jgi:hypothetical protein